MFFHIQLFSSFIYVSISPSKPFMSSGFLVTLLFVIDLTYHQSFMTLWQQPSFHLHKGHMWPCEHMLWSFYWFYLGSLLTLHVLCYHKILPEVTIFVLMWPKWQQRSIQRLPLSDDSNLTGQWTVPLQNTVLKSSFNLFILHINKHKA